VGAVGLVLTVGVVGLVVTVGVVGLVVAVVTFGPLVVAAVGKDSWGNRMNCWPSGSLEAIRACFNANKL